MRCAPQAKSKCICGAVSVGGSLGLQVPHAQVGRGGQERPHPTQASWLRKLALCRLVQINFALSCTWNVSIPTADWLHTATKGDLLYLSGVRNSFGPSCSVCCGGRRASSHQIVKRRRAGSGATGSRRTREALLAPH